MEEVVEDEVELVLRGGGAQASLSCQVSLLKGLAGFGPIGEISVSYFSLLLFLVNCRLHHTPHPSIITSRM
jgi:hypothetical protein